MLHDPERVAMEFAEKLASRHRHVVFLLGAGASCAAGLPNIAELATRVHDELCDVDRDAFEAVSVNRNLEQVLTRLRLIAEVLEDDAATLDGLTSLSATALDQSICAAIASIMKRETLVMDAHHRFANWLGLCRYVAPVEVFTTNYDTCIEAALEARSVPYFDGFVGNHRARFRPDLVEISAQDEHYAPPPGWVRLWKLHGSVCWTRVEEDGTSCVLRCAQADAVAPGAALAIYPSNQKYEESRRLPFVALADRLRRSLAIAETLCVVAGYSFGDEHINEVLYDSARFHESSETVALLFDNVPAGILEQARMIPNLTLLAPSMSVIGSVEADWKTYADDASFWKDGKFSLGGFDDLCRFLMLDANRRGSVVSGDGVK